MRGTPGPGLLCQSLLAALAATGSGRGSCFLNMGIKGVVTMLAHSLAGGAVASLALLAAALEVVVFLGVPMAPEKSVLLGREPTVDEGTVNSCPLGDEERSSTWPN